MFCFPYAGSSAEPFKKWSKYLKDVEVIPFELSGRGSRMQEDLNNNFEEIVEDVLERFQVQIKSSDKYALFGHSMGGLIVFELLHKIDKLKLPRPKAVFISGCTCPSRRSNQRKHLLPDEEFYQEVKNLGGMDSYFFENKDLLNMFGPIIRSDYKNTENYEKNNNYSVLDIDLFIMYGSEDTATRGPKVQDWKIETKGKCNFKEFEGEHFFIKEQEKEVIEYINSMLEFIY